MALLGRMLVMQVSLVGSVLLVLILAAATTTDAQSLPQALPGCTERCGNLTIPYPFGIGDGCYLLQGDKDFAIDCNKSTDPPKAYWAGSNIIATNFSLAEAEMQILQHVAQDCYDENAMGMDSNSPYLSVPPFTISDTKNKFIAVGCDTYAIFQGFRGEEEFITGCMSLCNNLSSVDQDSCSGVGCCQTNIPVGLNNRTVTLSSYNNHTNIWDFNPCSYAFIVEEGQFTFSNKSFQQLSSVEQLPMVLNWAIGVEPDSCTEAAKRQDFACKGNNSKCVNRINRNGYFCQCLPGYEGNPYLPGGCHDIDECKSDLCHNGICTNLPGNYSCSCLKGHRMENTTCVKDNSTSKNSTPLKISLGITMSFFVLLVAIFWIYCGMKRRKFKKLQDKYFKQNGGLLLKQQLASYDGSVETAARIFTEEELKKATNNYHVSGKIGEGAYGTVYKGILSDEKVVAIKKSKINSAPAQSNQFVNEVIVLSQISHRNVVRLLGCCLETPTPLLVYEYITNGTLYDHIHKKDGKAGPPPLSLELRLNIAADTAEALAYLHYSTSLQIIHRDVKATNILLEKDYTAKVSDFGASRLVPEDQNQLSTLVQGTLGYLDPEYLQSNTLTEKSDVYSFGVVLVELLTSQKALSFQKPEAERNLGNYFVCSMEKGHLGQIVDTEVVKDGNFETVEKVADLAKRCLRLKGEERPTMRTVSMELEELLRDMTKHAGGGKTDFKRSPKDTDHLLGSPNLNAYVVDVKGEGDDGGSSSNITNTLEYDSSMQTHAQMLKPYDAGR